MNLVAHCPQCGKSFRVKNPDLAGKKIKCKCGGVMTVQEQSSSPNPSPLPNQSPGGPQGSSVDTPVDQNYGSWKPAPTPAPRPPEPTRSSASRNGSGFKSNWSGIEITLLIVGGFSILSGIHGMYGVFSNIRGIIGISQLVELAERMREQGTELPLASQILVAHVFRLFRNVLRIGLGVCGVGLIYQVMDKNAKTHPLARHAIPAGAILSVLKIVLSVLVAISAAITQMSIGREAVGVGWASLSFATVLTAVFFFFDIFADLYLPVPEPKKFDWFDSLGAAIPRMANPGIGLIQHCRFQAEPCRRGETSNATSSHPRPAFARSLLAPVVCCRRAYDYRQTQTVAGSLKAIILIRFSLTPGKRPSRAASTRKFLARFRRWFR